METINMHEAKTHLSRLVKKAAAGEPFVIAIAGKPMVKVEAVQLREKDEPQRAVKRIGGLKGIYRKPEDWKAPFEQDIEEMFYGK